MGTGLASVARRHRHAGLLICGRIVLGHVHTVYLIASSIAAVSLPTALGEGSLPVSNVSLNWKEFENNGYIVVPGVLRPDQIARAKAAMLTSNDAYRSLMQFRQEGSLLDHDPIFIEILESLTEEVDAKMFEILGHWIVGAYAQITLNALPDPHREKLREAMPKAKSAGMHSDYPYGGHAGCRDDCFERTPPHYPTTVQLIFMLDNFTADNGATLVLPGSNRDRVVPNKFEHRELFGEQAVSVLGNAGDMLMYIGFVWHGSGVNVAETPRTGLVIQCLPYFMKPMHSHMYMFPSRLARHLSPKLHDRLGLKGWSSFGHTSNLGGGHLRHAAVFLHDIMLYGHPNWNQSSTFLACFLSVVLSLCGIREGAKWACAVLVGMVLGVSVTLQKFQV